jgi:hypothetical protein
MYLKLPYAVMTKSNSCLVNKHSFPYSLDFYNPFVEGDIYTLKITLDEVCDIARRYVIIYPATVQVVEGEKENQFRCLVNDDAS